MSTQYKSMRTELERVGNPYKNNQINRTAYYTNVYFEINGKKVFIPMKVDTGATYTVIGTYNTKIEKWRDIINKSNIVGKAYDASNTEINLRGYILSNFRLTKDIIFPKIKIFFSDTLGDRAVLGMDILSLFDFQYRHEKGNMIGTFWINNYEEYLQKINNILKKKNLDYLDAEQIFLLDNFESENKNSIRYTVQDLSANYIQDKLNQISDK